MFMNYPGPRGSQRDEVSVIRRRSQESNADGRLVSSARLLSTPTSNNAALGERQVSSVRLLSTSTSNNATLAQAPI